MINYKGYALLSLFSAAVALAITFMLKASVGVGAFDAATQSLSVLSGIRIGTIAMSLNLTFVIGQFIILKKNFGFTRFLQIPLSILIGMLVNFFYYDLFAAVEFSTYAGSMLVYILALILASFSVSMVMTLNLVTFPIESLCLALTKKLPIKFAVIRQLADILFIAVSVGLTFVFGLSPAVREGTVIGMLLFSPLMGFFISKVHPVLTKKGIVEEVRV
ncbi:membrane protein [Alkalibacterium psychrotolerans]